MKRKLCYLFSIMVILAAVGAAFSYAGNFFEKNSGTIGKDPEDAFRIVASFYPVYVIAENLIEGVPGVELTNLTQNQTGCLHDYQLTTKDMKQLEMADVLLINGGGMESFLTSALGNFPDLPIVSSCDGIDLLEGEEHHAHDGHAWEEESQKHEEPGHDGHDHEEEYNAHVWLDPNRYEEQVENLASGLIAADPKHRGLYEKNRDAYIEKIHRVKEEYEEVFTGKTEKMPLVLFHDAFCYLTEWLPYETIHVVEIEGENSALSAGELAEVIEEIHVHKVPYLLVEEQYSESIADQIAGETDATVLVLDSLVTGNGEKDSWIIGMQKNLDALVQIYFNK